MQLSVGSTVTQHDKPASEHGVITQVSEGTVVVWWHLKQDEVRGRAGTPVGTLYENPTTLMPDVACKYCKSD